MMMIKKLNDAIKSFFTKDRYIVTGSLQSEEFNVFVYPGDTEKLLLLQYCRSLKNSTDKNDLLENRFKLKHAAIYSSEFELLESTINKIKIDHKENLRVSENKKQYDFYYFFDKCSQSTKKVCITARLFKPDDAKVGDVYYDLIIKKYDGSFYQWGFDN